MDLLMNLSTSYKNEACKFILPVFENGDDIVL